MRRHLVRRTAERGGMVPAAGNGQMFYKGEIEYVQMKKVLGSEV